MNPLHLSGYGVKVKVEKLRSQSRLSITDGRGDRIEEWSQRTYKFRPRRIPYDSIIIDGHSGYISLQAFHWLSHNKIPLFILNYDGTLITSILPPMPVKADLRAAQIQVYLDPTKKFAIAKCIVKAKLARSLQVLDSLAQRYDIEREMRLAKRGAAQVAECDDVADLRSVEGRVATKYWLAIRKVMPESFLFEGRMTSSHQYNASDPVNLTLNYAYGVLEGECRRAINTVGLEPSVGFLHDFADYQTKQSLVYDLQEPYRWLADVTVIEAIESRLLDLKGFYFTGDDYRYRIEVDAKRRLLGLLRERFNSGVQYNGQRLKWDTVIEQKTVELGRYLLGKAPIPDFSTPSPMLSRQDSRELRARILALTQSEGARLGIGKSTLHYLRKSAKSNKSFRTYLKVRERLEQTHVWRGHN